MSVPPTTVFWPGLPNLLDTADGVTKYPPFGSAGFNPSITVGTPDKPQNLQVAAANGAVQIEGIQIEELPDSPELERAEQATCTKRFRMPYATGTSLINYLGRGLILQDNEGRTVRILSTNIKREKPKFCVLTIVSEGLSFDAPPDEFNVTPIELGVGILKFPRYFYALLPTSTDDPFVVAAKQAIVRAIQTYQDSPLYPPSGGTVLNGLLLSNGQLTGQVQDNIFSQLSSGKLVAPMPNINFNVNFNSTLDSSWPIQSFGAIAYPPVPTANGQTNPVNVRVNCSINLATDTRAVDAAYAAACEIIQKLWRQEDTPYEVALQLEWSTFTFIKPFYNPGGYIENPITDVGIGNPGLPAYFGSPSFDYGINTIFDDIALINPQSYSQSGLSSDPVSISWLRKADVVEYQRTWFKTTRTWIGAANAHWDKDFYNQNQRPFTGSLMSTYPFGYDVLPTEF